MQQIISHAKKAHKVMHAILTQSISHPHKSTRGVKRHLNQHLENLHHVTASWMLAGLIGIYSFLGASFVRDEIYAATSSEVPYRVIGLVATPGSGSVDLSWNPATLPNASYPVLDYVVVYKRSTSTKYSLIADGISTTTRIRLSLPVGNSYDFRVAAKNSQGTGLYSARVRAAVPSTTNTPTPTPINGSCGTSTNQSFTTAPTTGLCTLGTASSVTTLTSSFTWSCGGTNGGTTASCSATRTVAPPPAPTYTYSWTTSSWSACSATCGGGTQTRSVTCTRNDGVTVADSSCTTTKPSTSQACNTTACAPAPVNGSCGTSTNQSFTSAPTAGLCTLGTSSSVTTLTSSFTWSCGGTNGGTTASCSATRTVAPPPAPTYTYSWTTASWSACSATCGGGTQTRSVVCTRNDGVTVADSSCTTTKPSTSQACNTTACAPAPVNGSCGSSTNQSFTTAPTTGLCTLGTASGVTTGTSTFTWSCSGTNGGTPASCSATRSTTTHVHSGTYTYVDPALVPGPGNISSTAFLVVPSPFVPSVSDIGAFRLLCQYSHMNFDDPIVYPGQPGRSHLHTYFGNTNVTGNTTEQSLRTNGGSTCQGGTANRSAYWIPSIIDTRNGQPIVPRSDIFIYYKAGYAGVRSESIVPFPAGLRMISGNPKATTPPPLYSERHEWYCGDRDHTVAYGNGTAIPTCRAGDRLNLALSFPQCWDGVNLDSPNHQSHMAYPNAPNGCPSSHPISFVEVSFQFSWDVPYTNDSSTWRLSSDVADTSVPAGYSIHGDWFNGWDQSIHSTWITRCINERRDCGVGDLGDGRFLQTLN